MHRISLLQTLTITICVLSAVIAPLSMPGCSKAEPPVPSVPGEPVPAEPPSELTSEGASTLRMLQWIPQEAQVVAVVPSFSALEAQILSMDERLRSIAFKDTYQKQLLQVGIEHSLGVITNIEDLAKAKGIDSTKPVALYADMAPFMESAGASMLELQANPGSDPEAILEDLMELENYNFVIAFSASDMDLARKSMEDLLKELDPTIKESGMEESAGTSIVTYNGFGYAFASETLFVGSLDLLKATLAKTGDPTPLRYGSPAFPQGSPDEAVMLTYGGRVYPMYEKLFTQMAQDPAMKAMLPMQLEQLKSMVPKEGTDEPTVTTFIWDDEKIEMRSRMELEYFPHALDALGKPGMLRLTPMLPENTLAFASMRITDTMKAAILQQMKASMQTLGEDNAEAQQIAMVAQQISEILGDEFTMGFAAGGEGMPNACAMLSLQNPDLVKTMLQMFAATFLEVSETYKDIEISTVKAPIPVQIAVAFPKDIALVSTNLTDMKSIIDLYLSGQTSGLLNSMEPPFDTTREHYGVFSLDGKLITDIVLPLAALSGQANPEGLKVAQEFSALIDEIRMTSSVSEKWMESEMTVHFLPAQ